MDLEFGPVEDFTAQKAKQQVRTPVDQMSPSPPQDTISVSVANSGTDAELSRRRTFARSRIRVLVFGQLGSSLNTTTSAVTSGLPDQSE